MKQKLTHFEVEGPYVAPEIVTFEVIVESGFAATDTHSVPDYGKGDNWSNS